MGRPWGDDDAVLALSIDRDQGDARRVLIGTSHVLREDALRFERLERAIAERIGAQTRGESDAGARARGSDGLVCSLSAKGLQHVSTEDGFAGKRKGFGSTDEVDVRRAQYEHARVVRVFERHRI